MTAIDSERQTYFERMPVARIHADPINPRHTIDVDDDFITSIRAGIIEPLVVRPDRTRLTIDDEPADFLIIAGHRRHIAAQVVELETVPCRVLYDVDDAAVLEMMLAENSQRENLTPLEEAEAYKQLIDLGRAQRDIAKHVGRGQGTVSKRLSLLKLPERAKVLLDSGRISVQTALGMTGLVKHGDALGRVLDFATMGGDIDDRRVGRLVFQELERIKHEKERAKKPPPSKATTNGDAADDDDLADDDEEPLPLQRRADAAAARKSLIANLLGDGYPGDDRALAHAALIYTTSVAEDRPEELVAAFGTDPATLTDPEISALAETLIVAEPGRAALAVALDEGEDARRYTGLVSMQRAHLVFLQEHGYQLQLPEERALFGDTIPDGTHENDENAEVNAAPAPPDGQHADEATSTETRSPDHQGDEATEGAATSALSETAAIARHIAAWKGYPGHTPKMICNIIRNKPADDVSDLLAYERAHEARAEIIDAAEARLGELETVNA